LWTKGIHSLIEAMATKPRYNSLVFAVSGCDPAPVLEFVEELLDKVR
jgi:hypothetical protein